MVKEVGDNALQTRSLCVLVIYLAYQRQPFISSVGKHGKSEQRL